MNAVYGLPRFEIESVHPLWNPQWCWQCWWSWPMMMNIALPQILPWSWHCQIITCMFISKEYLRTQSRFRVLWFWPRPGWEFYAQNRKAQIICGCVNEEGGWPAYLWCRINHQTWPACYLPALLPPSNTILIQFIELILSKICCSMLARLYKTSSQAR